ncbi:MAG: hypothetical protein JWP12_353 [Bacteroidetes bacterium]|nr:hypothetical protein [Bacteroidota bacterium]
MYKSGQFFFLVLLLLLAGKNVSAQDPLTAGAAEEVSYRLYQQGSWDSLAAYCDKAIAAGYDYYYMRMRAGIACYKKTDYRKAILHFEKALTFNASDDAANEYLYFCYTYSGEYDQARWLAKDFDSTFSAAAGIKKVPVSMLLLEGGTKLSSSDLFQPVVYAHAALSHYVNSRVSLFHAFTYYGQKESRYTINQYQYYLGASIPLQKRWSVSAGAQVMYNRNIYRDSVDVLMQQGFMGGGGGPPPPPPSGQTTKVLESVTKNEWNYIAAFTIKKSVTHFSAALGATYWYRDTASFYQLNGNVTYYPFANNLLSISADVYLHTINNFKNNYVSVAPAVTLNFKKWNLTAGYLNNAGGNAIEHTGYVVNNSEDLSRDRYTLSLAYRIKKLSVYCTYSYETKEMAEKNLHYNYNTFIAGICFTPY